MRRSVSSDPYREVMRAFNRAGVRCVVVGMSGINYYAKSPAQTFGTLDYDIFIEPTVGNVEKALAVVRKLGFAVGPQPKAAGKGGKPSGEWLKALVRDRRTLTATTPEGLMVELLLQVSGYPFSEMARDALTVTVGGVPVRVGRLSKLLGSKRIAGRPKDRSFLRRYRNLLKEP